MDRAQVRNLGTCRLVCVERVESMQRERPKRRPREAESTDDGGFASPARHRGGMIRSSDDRP